ncbi:MAG: GGDEF domain-containing protein, partial [Eubacteriales bacterium]
MKDVKDKKTGLLGSVAVLLLAVLLVSTHFYRNLGVLDSAYNDMGRMEYLSATTQRLVSLVQSGEYEQEDVTVLSVMTHRALQLHQADTLSVLDDSQTVFLANKVLLSWMEIEALLGADSFVKLEKLTVAREGHYFATNELISHIDGKITELSREILIYQIIAFGLFLVLLSIVCWDLVKTHKKLDESFALAQMAQLDLATGLYNRSKCQEIFKLHHSTAGSNTPAIIVIDLNDLKKTNDTLGHRVGDELISGFAGVLKHACQTLATIPFMGRYGGDEFVVFFEDVREVDIKVYLAEIEHFVLEFNKAEVRFQLSYAVGVAMSTKEKKFTARQLFDQADAAMYEHKSLSKSEGNLGKESVELEMDGYHPLM